MSPHQPDAQYLNYTHDEARQLAYEATKLTYTQAMGWLVKAGHRHDHWSMIVATARNKMRFKMRWLEQRGYPACYCKVDALGIIAPAEERTDIPLLIHPGGLGSYKHVASGPLTQELARAFDGDFSAADKALGKWRDMYEQ